MIVIWGGNNGGGNNACITRFLDLHISSCSDCGRKPGQPHMAGCDTEVCSACGRQWIQCACKDHDPEFAKWTGYWPGFNESVILGIDLNEIHSNLTYVDIFFKKGEKTLRCPDHPKYKGVRQPKTCRVCWAIWHVINVQRRITIKTLDVWKELEE